jgi:cytoskeleton protein RodZ
MSETTQIPETGAAPPVPDRVGDILRKERVTKRIALETIARDLKLNVRYIKSIEANDYNDLPADPYIRVYLRSMAKYLSLDPEEVLKRFNRERGAATEEEPAERPTTKLDVAMNVHQVKKPKMPPWPYIAALVGVLLVIAFIASRMGQSSPPKAPAARAVDSSAVKRLKPVSADTMADSIPEKRPDSLDTNAMPAAARGAAARAAAAKDSTAKAAAAKAATPAKDSVAKPADSLTLIVRAEKDSVWLQVFADGKVWKNTLQKGESRIFRARDSLNVHDGNHSAAQYVFNGKPVSNVPGAGIVTFKADRSGIEEWPLAKWMSVFKNRIR